MVRTARPRLAILGAGPLGLEAALYAVHFQLPFTVFERGHVGQALRHWGHARLFTPFGLNASPLAKAALLRERPGQSLPGDTSLLTGHEFLRDYLEPLAQIPALAANLRTEKEVLGVGRRGCLSSDLLDETRRRQHPFVLLLRDAKGRERYEEADAVLDCTGVYGRHRWAGLGGLPARGERATEPHIAYGLEDVLGERRGHYAGKTTLVLGAGHSAATTVGDLATLAEKEQATWVMWAARGSSSLPIRRVTGDPLRERDRVAMRANQLAARCDGNVEFHPGTWLESIEGDNNGGFLIEVRKGGQALEWQVDRVIANVGYRLDSRLGDELRPGEPDYFVLGGRGSERPAGFLLQEGLAQVRAVFRRLTGKDADVPAR